MSDFIPARGYQLVTVSGVTHAYSLEPIIAFRWNANAARVDVVTLSGDKPYDKPFGDDSDDVAVMYPDGQIMSSQWGVFDTIEDFVRDCDERDAEEKAFRRAVKEMT
jgi:hypothetical protein